MADQIINGPQGKLMVSEGGASSREPGVVLLHADVGSREQWSKVFSLLAEQRYVIAFDFRGHGASEPARNGDYGHDGRAADVLAVADAFGLKSFVIVAHSGAAPVAMALGSDERVEGLLLVDPATDPRLMPVEVRTEMLAKLRTSGAQAVKGYYASIAGRDEAVRDQVLADVDNTAAEVCLGVAEALSSWDPEVSLKRVSVPIEIISTPVTDEPGALYRLKDGIPHLLIEDAGHWVQMERPHDVAELINHFVAKVATTKVHHGL